MTKQNLTIDLLYDDGAGQDWQGAPCYVRDGVTISRGLAAESGEPEPSKLSLTLDNRSGAYNPNNPASPLYGAAGRNTPLAVAVDGDDRLRCEAADWAPRRTLEPVTADRGDAWTLISGAGVLRRLGRGQKPLRSALYRAITRVSPAPVGYWPMEDGKLVSNPTAVVGSPLVAAPAALFSHAGTGSVSGAVDGPPGGAQAVDMSGGGQLTGYVSGMSGTSWRVGLGFSFRTPVAATESGDVITINTVDSAGNPGWWRFGQANASVWGFEYGILGVSTVVDDGFGTPVPVVDDGAWHWLEIAAENGSGTNANVKVFLDGFGVVDDVNRGFVKAGLIRSIVVAESGDLDGAAHLAVWPTNGALSIDVADAFRGHAGEPAGTRIARLCEEENLDVGIVGDEDDTQPMGAQPAETLLEVLAECARTDAGMLYEPRGHADLAYRTCRSLYNQDPVLALTYQQVTWPLEPVVGDAGVRNDVTAARRGGSTARVALDAGAMSTAAPPDGVGRYEHRLDVNPPKDDVLPLLASWAVGKGTVDETRYAQVSVELTDAAFDLVELAGGVDVGDRVTLSGIPAADTPDVVDMLVTRVAETLGSHTRAITFDTIPYRPFEVFQVEAPGNLGRVDSGNTTLHAAIDATQTSVVIEAPTAAGPFWRAGTPPGGSMDIAVAGERMTVTNIGAAGGTTQTFTVTRSVNGVAKSHKASTAVRLWRPGRIAL